MALLIKNGTIITASETFQADILVEDEKITSIGEGLSHPSAEVVDARGKLVMPGGVDPHVHLELPMFGTVSSDDHYTGHRAAAFGGTTTALDFISQDHRTLKQDVAAWHEKADAKAAIDYGFHINITRLDRALGEEIPSLVDAGITSLKVFTAYNNRLRLDDAGIFLTMRIARDAGMLTMLHAENGDVIDILVQEALQAGHLSPAWHARTRPAWGAVEAVLRGRGDLAQANAALYVVHLNAAGEVDQLEYARRQGLKVMGETCPQYLFLSDDLLEREDGSKWICSPPIRKPSDHVRLWEGLKRGTIQTIGTDHCPFFYDGTTPILYEGKPVAIPGKELGKDNFTLIPNGLPAIEDRLPILWTYGVGQGLITPNQFVELTSTNPAKIFGMYPRKGSILPGADADLVIWNPDKRVTYGVKHAHMRTDYNLYEGWELVGIPEKVYLRGRLIVDGDRWLGKAGQGKYLSRVPFAPVL
jgi:dihydropyrimidinase